MGHKREQPDRPAPIASYGLVECGLVEKPTQRVGHPAAMGWLNVGWCGETHPKGGPPGGNWYKALVAEWEKEVKRSEAERALKNLEKGRHKD
jgi:hypothetical protein